MFDESILDSIKKDLGIDPSCNDFDSNIINHINSAFMTLNQLGVGPEKGYRIKNNSNEWKEYFKEEDNIDAVKDYIYLKVKMIFDPPINGSVIESYKQQIQELEWRLMIKGDEQHE